MNRKLSFVLIACLLFSLCAISGPLAYAEDWKLPDGTQIYKPGRTMALDFGTFTILDAGFAKSAQSIIQANTAFIEVNGERVTPENINVGYYTAQDGKALFAFKGLLYNSSDQLITLDTLKPSARFDDEKTIPVYGYPAVAFGTPEYFTLAPNEDVEIVFQCTVPDGFYHGRGDILLEFAGGTLGFQRGNIGNYVSVGFTDSDGEKAGDITEMRNEENTTPAKEDESPHIDELCVEDVSLKYKDKNGKYYLDVKVRNTGYPTFEDRKVNRVTVNYMFIDENGDGVPANSSSIADYADLRDGQAGWHKGGDFSIDQTTLDAAHAITFNSYGIYAENASGQTKGFTGTISDPPVFLLDDIMEGRESSASQPSPIQVENVSVEFMDTLPDNVMQSQALRTIADEWKEDNINLSDSQTFAAIRFTLTNLSKQQFCVSGIGGHFVVRLDYDDGFLYDTEGPGYCIFSHANTSALNVHGASLERIDIDPLVTMDVTVYLSVAKAVSTGTDKPLVVSFLTDLAGKQQIDVKIR